MNSYKLITVLALAVLTASSVIAQQPNSQTTTIKKVVNIDSLCTRIQHYEQLIAVMRKDADKVTLLQKISTDKDTIIVLLNNSITEKNEIISSNEAELNVIRFFKRDDISVFTENLDFSAQDVPTYFQNQFQLILDIRKLKKQLDSIENEITEIESSGIYKDQPVHLKLTVLKNVIQKDIDNANLLFEHIDKKDKSGLSPEQISFYNSALANKFNSFLDKVSE